MLHVIATSVKYARDIWSTGIAQRLVYYGAVYRRAECQALEWQNVAICRVQIAPHAIACQLLFASRQRAQHAALVAAVHCQCFSHVYALFWIIRHD